MCGLTDLKNQRTHLLRDNLIYKARDLESGRCVSKHWLYLLLAIWPGTSLSGSLNLNPRVCEMGVTMLALTVTWLGLNSKRKNTVVVNKQQLSNKSGVVNK